MSAWLGEWVLIPEISDYGKWEPRPQSISISEDGTEIRITVKHQDVTAAVHYNRDGTLTPIVDGPSTDRQTKLIASDEFGVDTEIFDDGKSTVRSQRRVSQCGTIMSAKHHATAPEGPMTFWEVFRRR